MCKIFRTKKLESLRIISKLNIQLQDYLEVCRESSEESGKRLQGFPFWSVGPMLRGPANYQFAELEPYHTVSLWKNWLATVK